MRNSHSIPYLLFGLGVLFLLFSSCKDDLNNVGADLAENNVFDTQSIDIETISYSQKVVHNRSDNIKSNNSDLLLGVKHSAQFGTLTASVASQVQLPGDATDYGSEPTIDKVYLHIPFGFKTEGRYDDGKPKFLFDDSVWHEGNNKFQFTLSRLGTYLDAHDPENPADFNAYYSDEDLITTEELFSGVIAPSVNDTILIIPRYKYPDYPDLSDPVLYTTDTIPENDRFPSLNIELDKDYFQTNFIDAADDPAFASQSNFNYYYRGLLLQAAEAYTNNASLMKLDMSKVSIDIYYTKKETVDEEEDQDLNGNGINGESNVSIHTPNKKQFFLGGVQFNLYDRDYTGSVAESYLATPDTNAGEDKLFVQGASGSTLAFDLFGSDNDANGIPDGLDELKTKNWLINDAQLVLYVTEDSEDEVPALILYNRAENEDEEDSYIFKAYEQNGPVAALEKDEDDKPLLYRFHITDLISELIKPDSEISWKNWGVKIFEPDVDIISTAMDEEPVTNYSFEHKGVVLYGNNTTETDKRPRLIIYYTEKN